MCLVGRGVVRSTKLPFDGNTVVCLRWSSGVGVLFLLRESFCGPVEAVGPMDFVRCREKKLENALPPPLAFVELLFKDLDSPCELLPDEGVGGSVEELEDKVENSVEADDELSGALIAVSGEVATSDLCLGVGGKEGDEVGRGEYCRTGG